MKSPGIRQYLGMTPAVVILLSSLVGCAETRRELPSAWTGPAGEARLHWWREARFGLFIHWGPVSLQGTEIGWSRNGERRGTGGPPGMVPVDVYDNLYRQFNPTGFNADEWVRLAQDAGMKYLVFTAKHHDGFVNFDSALTDYKITSPASPYRKDIVARLARACHRANLPLGFYYSPPDWHHPDYRTENHARYVQYLHGQIRELCSNYGPVSIIWFDGLNGTAEDWDSPNLFKLIHDLQPSAIINNRAGLPADFDTPEQVIGEFRTDRPWETCMTLGDQWSYRPNDRIKSLKECIQNLVRAAGGDGNFLFNVGPMPDGRIEPRQADRLREMGRWLAKYGRSIYETRGGPFKPTSWGASTHRGNRVYLHVLEWPGEEILIPQLPRKVVGSRLLTGGQVMISQRDEQLAVWVEEPSKRDIDTIIILDLDGPAGDIPPVNLPSGSAAFGVKAEASNVYQQSVDFAAGKAFDDDCSSRWATDAGTKTAWLAVDLGRARLISRALISEACGNRVRSFTLEYQDGNEWRVLHRGTSIGNNLRVTFNPVTAQHFRLNIHDATEGPTIYELQLF